MLSCSHFVYINFTTISDSSEESSFLFCLLSLNTFPVIMVTMQTKWPSPLCLFQNSFYPLITTKSVQEEEDMGQDTTDIKPSKVYYFFILVKTKVEASK